MRTTVLALAASSVAALNIGTLSQVPLRPVVDGRAANEAALTAGDLWKERGAVVFAVRRAGWNLCREEAYDLCATSAAYPSVPAVAILKEAETEETLAKEKKNLGTAEFVSSYFTCGPVYVDEARTFYQELGDRKIDFKLGRLFTNPLGTWRDLKALGERLKAKGNIEGNLVGEGLTLGGIMVISPSGEELYTYREVTGQEIPKDEIAAALDKLVEMQGMAGVVTPASQGAPTGVAAQ